MASHDSWKQQHVGNVKLSDDDWQFHPKTWKGPQHVLPRSQPFINNKNMANPPDEYAAAAFRKMNSVSERRDQLQRWYPGLNVSCLADGGLSDELANGLIENTVGRVALPVGVAVNFTINSRKFVIPMAVEEPSVVAAASNSAKLVQKYSKVGFEAGATRSLMIAQIEIRGLSDIQSAHAAVEAKRAELTKVANTFCAGMVKRGGGVLDIEPRQLEHRAKDKQPGTGVLIVHVHVDVCDAMGANAVNTVAEALSPSVLEIIKAASALNVNAQCGLCILSNLCAERRAWATFCLPTSALTRQPKGETSGNLEHSNGARIAERIVQAWEFARDDPYRACTHNKGIMNGVGAVAVATGQDWRAVEAAAHAFACMGSTGSEWAGRYQPLTQYRVEGDFLHGRIELPVPVGTQGGSVKAHPVYSTMLELLGSPSAPELATVMACVGLAQNFAALRAMSSEGIQKGHMALHKRKDENTKSKL